MEPVETQVLLAGLERRAGALAAEHDASLSTTFEENGIVRVDPARVEQAILALVGFVLPLLQEESEVR